MGLQTASTGSAIQCRRSHSSGQAEDPEWNVGGHSERTVTAQVTTTSTDEGTAADGHAPQSHAPAQAADGRWRGHLLEQVAAEFAENEGYLQRSDEYVSTALNLFY